ncbi:hypothetical protein DCD76_18555, partial [Acinetobacter baumannii]|uniref:hypothetical protein n=1 Tax=Acinetobacter baumannii TaxID=470 RepID=UPI000DE70B7B
GKKFLILFDNDNGGKSNAENLRGEFSKRNISAISRFLFDSLSQADQTELGNKIDANELLITRGDQFLNELVSKIIEDSQADFATIEKEIADAKLFNHLVAQWRTNHKNAPVDPKIIVELKDAKAYVDNLTPENFNPDDIFNISI